MSDIAAGALQTGIAVIDPNARPRSLERIFRHERHSGIFFVEVFVDDRRLVNDRVAVYQHRHLAVGIQLEQLPGFVLKVAFDEIVGELFFRQDKPCPVGVRSSVARIEFHHFRF